MLNSLLIEATEDTPKVFLNKQNGVFEITGRSFPEDASKFYARVLNWMEEYIKEPCIETVFCFNLEYFNSTSVKQLLEVLIKLEELAVAGKKVHVVWSYGKRDELMAAKGQEMQKVVNLPFELKPID